ncbi:hypothetical protein HYW87_01040 [Candidatus Roizmanbacteria bacterium]|nr:hypothetical protein [Candidatus Roizmanbacteria bacterium]
MINNKEGIELFFNNYQLVIVDYFFRLFTTSPLLASLNVVKDTIYDVIYAWSSMVVDVLKLPADSVNFSDNFWGEVSSSFLRNYGT